MNVRRHLWHKDISDKCTFCHQQPETVTHLLITCPEVTRLWSRLEKFVKYFYNFEAFELMKSTIILNNYKNNHEMQINMFIAIMKQYIYAKKCFEKLPSFMEFTSKLSHWYRVEKYIIYQENNNKKIKKFNLKWANIFWIYFVQPLRNSPNMITLVDTGI